jgi:hypothetical protein
VTSALFYGIVIAGIPGICPDIIGFPFMLGRPGIANPNGIQGYIVGFCKDD